MSQRFLHLAVCGGLLTLACATAIEQDVPFDGDDGEDSGGSLGVAGSRGGVAGAAVTASAGKGGSPSGAFGGSSSRGGMGGKAGAGSAGKASGGTTASAGRAGAGQAGGANGGSPTMGGGGSASAGAPASTMCDGVADWTSKTYAIGDLVASTCAGVFHGDCQEGQAHEFECNPPPPGGAQALPWCMSREPGVGNGWQQAWVDKGRCQ